MATAAVYGDGLILATTASLFNVLTDVCRKKAVADNDVLGTQLWIRVGAAVVFLAAFCVHIAMSPGPLLHSTGAIFRSLGGGFGADWPPLEKFLVCLVLDGSLLAVALLYYMRALQVADLSLTVPYLAFTPVLLIPTGYLLLHEVPSTRQALGVILVVCGSIAMNKEAFREGWLGPVKAIFTQRGSRYMLLVSVVFSITNPIDKMIVLMSDPITAAFGYGAIMLACYVVLMLALRRPWGAPLRQAPRWIVAAGLLDAVTQLLQFTSHRFIDVVITITIKRAGILLSVVAGWLIFRERHVEDRLAAAFAMLSGAVLIYLPLGEAGQVVLTALVMVTLVFNLGRRSAGGAAKT